MLIVILFKLIRLEYISICFDLYFDLIYIYILQYLYIYYNINIYKIFIIILYIKYKFYSSYNKINFVPIKF